VSVTHDWSARIGIVCLYLATLTGGASRNDILMQIVPQLAGLCVLLLAVWNWRSFDGQYRSAVVFVLAALMLQIFQLIPLPPAIWTALPGRELLAQAADIAHFQQPWRPLSISPDQTQSSALGFVPVIGFTLLWPMLGNDAARRFAPHLIALGAISAVLGVLQVAGGNESSLRFFAITNSENAVGFFANRNHHAVLLAATLPMLAHWARAESPSRARADMRIYIGMALALFLVCSIVVAGSRSGLLLGALGILYFSIIVPLPSALSIHRPRAVPISKGAALSALAEPKRLIFPAVAVSITGFIAYLARATALERLVVGDVASDLRSRLIKPVLELTAGAFPFGTGFGTFERAFRIGEPTDMLTKKYVNHAHNDILEIVLEGGAFSILLAAAFLWLWGRALFAIWIRQDSRRSAVQFGRMGSIVTLAILVASVSDYPLRTPAMAVIFTICCMMMLTAASDQWVKTRPNGKCGET
jgi:O-antigen ligase